MNKLDDIREYQRKKIERQLQKEERKAISSDSKRRKRPKKNSKSKKILKSLLTLVMIMIVLAAIAAIFIINWATEGMDTNFDSFNRTGLNLSSQVYYLDDNGNEVLYEQLVADENRIWVDFENIPQNMKNAFVAIEDQRFYQHYGVDIKRTVGAVINVVFKGDSSYGGSTITQQLVKNITSDSERSNARKVREIIRSILLETKMSKDEILELYMNTIYLGHGANGVQAAAHAYFGKDVKDLTLVECTAIAGITQHPSTYDPYINPEGNKEKRLVVLNEMLSQGYIDKTTYQQACETQLVLANENGEDGMSQSYFVDNLFEELSADIMEEMGYNKQQAIDLIYNGGLKIISTLDPDIQKVMDDVYVNGNGFPYSNGSGPQSAMTITDPNTGEIKGMVGGRGEKKGARVLNRATQSYRQPGSTIKPVSVYGPALDTGVITLASSIDNSPLVIGEWKPKNANGKFSAPVNVRSAVAHSYNLPAIRVLEALTVDTSFDYMTNKLHLSLVDKKEGSVHTDKAYAPLALGGLTDGVTVLGMNAAYATFANKGEYIEPHSYTTVYDANGKVLLEKKPDKNQAFSEETAFLMSELLKGVVQSGTAAGSGIPGIDTCGKTGSTDDNYDRWFNGYTPYYAGTVWVGYDTQQVIYYSGNNPALTIWRAVMSKIHEGLPGKTFSKPANVEKAFICSNTGQYGTSQCSGVTDYANKNITKGYCDLNHTKRIGTPGVLEEEEDEENSENGENGENGEYDTKISNNSIEKKQIQNVKKPYKASPPPPRPESESGSTSQKIETRHSVEN